MNYIEKGKLNIMCCREYENEVLGDIINDYEYHGMHVIVHRDLIYPTSDINTIDIYSVTTNDGIDRLSSKDINDWMQLMMNNLNDDKIIILSIWNVDGIFESMETYGLLYNLIVVNVDGYANHISHELYIGSYFENLNSIYRLSCVNSDDDFNWNEIGIVYPDEFPMLSYSVDWF